jgi:hypothetical protein
VDNRSNAASAGRWFPRCGVNPANGAPLFGGVSVRNAHAAAIVVRFPKPEPAISSAVHVSRAGYDRITSNVSDNALSTLTWYAAM